MKSYDVIFIHPPRVMKPDYSKHAKFVRSTFIFIPMGVFAIADYLEREGLGVKIINYPLEQYLNREWNLADFLKKIDFNVCGIDLHWIHNAHGVIETAKIVKKVNSNAKVVLGGFSASYYHDQILKYYKSIDAVIRGDGEVPLLSYAQNINKNNDLDSVANLSYRNGSNQININPISYVAKSLNELNFTNVSFLENAKKYFEYSRRIMGIALNLPIARGCLFNCPCCAGGQRAQQKISGRDKVIFRNPEKVIEDIHNILDKYKVPSVFFGHGTYPSSLKYWKNLFKLIRKEKFDISGDLEIWRLPYPKEMWESFYKTFARRHSSISISPRTMSAKVQNKIAKICDPTFQFTKNQIQDLIKNANLFRMTLRIWLTMGYPFQTRRDVLKDYLFAIKCLIKYGSSNFKPITIMSEPYYIFPGSPAYENPERFEIKLDYNSFPKIADAFKRIKVTYTNRVLNYKTKYFSKTTNLIANNLLFLTVAPMFLTRGATYPKEKDCYKGRF